MSGDFSFQEVVGRIRELACDDCRFSVALRWQLEMKLDFIDQFPQPASTLQLKMDISKDMWDWMQVSNYTVSGNQLQICPSQEFTNAARDRRLTPDDLKKLREACSPDFRIDETITMIDMLGKEVNVKNSRPHTMPRVQHMPAHDRSRAPSDPVVGKRKSSAKKKRLAKKKKKAAAKNAKTSASKNAISSTVRNNGQDRSDLHQRLNLVISRNPRVAAAILEDHRRPLYRQIVSLAITRLANLTVKSFCRATEKKVMFPHLIQALDEAEVKHYIAVAKICGYFVLELIEDPSDEDLDAVKDWIFKQRSLFWDALEEAPSKGQQGSGSDVTGSRKKENALKMEPAQAHCGTTTPGTNWTAKNLSDRNLVSQDDSLKEEGM